MKKFLSVVLACFLLFNCLSPCLAANQNISEQQFLEMMAAQENALKANEILMENIVDENSQYPDYYGGVYIEDNILHIQLAGGASAETSAWISQLLSEYSDWVAIENVDYSYNDLYSLAETSAYSLSSETDNYEITGFYVDILDNEGVVTVSSDDVLTELEQASAVKRTTDMPLRFEIGTPSMYSLVDTDVSPTSSGIQPRSTITLKGGTTINNSSGWFTLGFCGTYGSLDAFVTCGHGQDTSAWTLTGGTIGSGDTLGGVSYLRYQNNGNGDFSIHTIASGLPNTVTLTNKIQNVSDSGTDISITGIYSDPPVGTYLFKYNATTTTTAVTKYRSYCEVTDVGVTILSNNTLYLRNMTQAKFVSSAGSAISGDSGGPIFVLNGSTWQIVGVLSGKSGTEYINFTPWKYISAAGFTAKTS